MGVWWAERDIKDVHIIKKIVYLQMWTKYFPCFSFPNFHCNKCIDRATTVDAVVGPGRKPTVSAVSKWEYFNGFSDDNWWFVNPEVYKKSL